MRLDQADPGAVCDATGMQTVRRWINDLGLTPDEVVEVVEATTTRRGAGDPPSSLAYFGKEIQKLADAKAAQPMQANPADPKKTSKPSKAKAPPATEAEMLDFWAKWVNGDKPLPPSAINNTKATALVRAGLVTPERMRERFPTF